jgi:hypothetical protein
MSRPLPAAERQAGSRSVRLQASVFGVSGGAVKREAG